MKIFYFRRILKDGARIFGDVIHNGMFLNMRFMENEKKAIKTGEYILKRDQEGKYVGYWEFQNVTGRTEIIIHIANWVHELTGCFGLGKRTGFLKGEPALVSSTSAVEEFMELTKDDDTIKVILEEPKDGAWVA